MADAQLIPRCFDRLNGLSTLDQETQDFIRRVTMAVLDDTDKDLSELEMVMTDGKAQLSDDERIKRLDNIYARVKDRLGFTQSFFNGVRLLLVQRANTLNDLNTLKSIYGIN
ncbi:hypothetical protein FHW88_000430 [Mucilaginibacter sp. SG538B]|uniref:hypothetical protein n=1 Tax=Mucilaginibacter sp. SG538B TaxID=2587021 RepID=UPI00159E3FDE|nr:hypothetical protein [Mucilaginibacter sp. SG538B]NVM62154.1 hypothetical protein [Mucilaginibacter sp. SG538B]